MSDVWMFSWSCDDEIDETVGGCCGVRQAREGVIKTNVRKDNLRYYRNFETVLDDANGRPVIFATTVTGSYYQFVIDQCVKHKLHYELSRVFINPSTSCYCGIITVYPADCGYPPA